jgi:hypothetical protein
VVVCVSLRSPCLVYLILLFKYLVDCNPNCYGYCALQSGSSSVVFERNRIGFLHTLRNSQVRDSNAGSEDMRVGGEGTNRGGLDSVGEWMASAPPERRLCSPPPRFHPRLSCRSRLRRRCPSRAQLIVDLQLRL